MFTLASMKPPSSSQHCVVVTQQRQLLEPPFCERDFFSQRLRWDTTFDHINLGPFMTKEEFSSRMAVIEQIWDVASWWQMTHLIQFPPRIASGGKNHFPVVELKVKVFDPAVKAWQEARHASHAPTAQPKSPRSLLSFLDKTGSSCEQCASEKAQASAWLELGTLPFRLADPWDWEFGRTQNHFGSSKLSGPHAAKVDAIQRDAYARIDALIANWNSSELNQRGIQWHPPSKFQNHFMEIHIAPDAPRLFGGPSSVVVPHAAQHDVFLVPPSAPPAELGPSKPTGQSLNRPFCVKCGAKNVQDTPYCGECGTYLKRE